MSASQIRSEIAALQKRAADLERQRAQHLERANSATKAAGDKMSQAARTKSESSRNMYARAVGRENKKHADEAKKVADLTRKIAETNRRLAEKSKALQTAEANERAKDERQAKARQQREDHEADKRRRLEKDHAREIAQFSRPQVRHVIIEPPKPEKLRVLYLTANAEVDRLLRVDAEVNNVLKAIRGAKYRDLIELHIRPAATPQDLIDGINDIRPHVVHFSGHGGAGILAFDNASLERPEIKIMEFGVLAELLSATATPPKLLVMNACKTLEGSAVLLEAVPILVAMAESVDDASAGVFATQFYSAIASAQSIGHALRQSRAMMKQSLMSEDWDLPQLAHRDDVDPNQLALIEGL